MTAGHDPVTVTNPPGPGPSWAWAPAWQADFTYAHIPARPHVLTVTHTVCGRAAFTVGPSGTLAETVNLAELHMAGCGENDMRPAVIPAALAAAAADVPGLAGMMARTDDLRAPILGPPPPGLTTSPDGTPPPGFHGTEARRWAAAWALHIQARLTILPGTTFRGIPAAPGGPLAGTGRVTVSLRTPGLLCYVVNVRDPGRPFAWGRYGAGPTALAASLLAAALGRHAACARCQGTGRVTSLHGRLVPWRPAHDDLDPPAVSDCQSCDGAGLGIHPAVTAELVTEMIAGWDPAKGWRVTRDELLAWTETQPTDRRLALAAARAPR
jgi:hypothetical protein